VQLDSSVAGRSRKAFTIDLAVHLIGLAEQGEAILRTISPGLAWSRILRIVTPAEILYLRPALSALLTE
jgi:hypothetical protein